MKQVMDGCRVKCNRQDGDVCSLVEVILPAKIGDGKYLGRS